MRIEAAVTRLKQDLDDAGELILASRLVGLQGMDAAKQLFEIILNELVPRCVGMTKFWQPLAYLEYLFKIGIYASEHEVSVVIYEMLLQVYDRLREIDENFGLSSSSLGSVRSWLLQTLIFRWGETPDQEEAARIFRRVRETAKEADRPILEEIKGFVRKHDGGCSPEKIESAIVNMRKDLPSGGTHELIELLSHRWVKGLDAEQITFLAKVKSWSSGDTETERQLMHEAILRATDQIREAWKAAREIQEQFSTCPNPYYKKARIVFLGPEEVFLRIDFPAYSEEELMKVRDGALAFIENNSSLRFEDLSCLIIVGNENEGGAFEGSVTWRNWSLSRS
jgi:hypothetical protein